MRKDCPRDSAQADRQRHIARAVRFNAAVHRRRGFTILELLTTVSVVSVLASLLLPAIGSARESARKIECVHNLRQIGLALHSYHDAHQCLPPGWQWQTLGQSAYAWGAACLPYLEQRQLYDVIFPGRPIGDSVNEVAWTASLPVFVCPSDVTQPSFTLYEETGIGSGETALVDLPTASYVGVFGTLEPDDTVPAPPGDGAFLEAKPVRFKEFRRGLSNTFVVGERTMARVPSTWLGADFRGEDAACRIVGQVLTNPNCDVCDECEFDSRHPGGVNFLWGDGHVSFIADAIDSTEYQMLARRSLD